MTAATPLPQPASGLDLSAFRLPANYGATLGVKKVLTTVQVGKPGRARFFRVRDGEDWELPVFVYENKEERETYLIYPPVAQTLGSLARPAKLHVATDRQGNPFLVPVFLPGEDGKRNPWHESLAQAVEAAKEKWVRISANMSAGYYDVLVAEAKLDEPNWIDATMNELIGVAFGGKIIRDVEHPVIRSLRGAV